MNSCLYECTVSHRRLVPVDHQFTYRIFMFSLDLAEVESISRKVRGFSHNGRNLYAFNDRDHLEADDRPIREKLEKYLATQGVTLPSRGRVQLVTLPRMLGYIFNPVSLFFCYDEQGKPLHAVVEVGNTFREIKLFFLPSPDKRMDFRLRAEKEFYVSPFSTLDTSFDFHLHLPDRRLDMRINDYKDGQLTLVSTLMGRQVPLTTKALWWFTLKYPLVTGKVIFLIHWQAFRLWLKRAPFIAKTASPEKQKDVLRPHRSLTTPP
jgi:uncharacterized protein